MPFRFARRVRNLEIKTYCPTKKKDLAGFSGGGSGRGSGSQQICPSCVLPIVVAFIFGFTVVQLIVIHRTIVAYKSRSLAFEEVYGPSRNETKSQGDLIAFSRKFDAAWLPPPSNSSRVAEWKPEQSYPYKIPGGISRAAHYPSPINHIWKVACPEVPTKLHGNISINIKKDVSLEELSRTNPEVLPGGRWTPEDCKPRFRVALIIPYRYRWNHLKLLLSVLHPMLRRQEMSYQIFVAEQYGNYTFNKGLLMNAAFLLALNSSSSFDCVIFHDVDLLPETDRNLYGCANTPTHLSVSIDAYGYRLPYSKLVGGVFAVSVSDFVLVNGYSNLYWGWGAEDDDMYKRLIANQLPINRPRPDLAKYKMLQHGRRVPNQFINPLIRTARLRFPQDGLTTCHFRLVSSSAQALFTHFLVDVGQPSYSVLEPHIHLESMIPPSPSHYNSNSNNNNPTPNLLQESAKQHHHHHPSQSSSPLDGGSREHLHHHNHNHLHHQQQKRSASGSGSNIKNGNNLFPSSPSASSSSPSSRATSISHRESATNAAASSTSIISNNNNNNEGKHFSSHSSEKDKENELFILSGIAWDAGDKNKDNLHFTQQSQSQTYLGQPVRETRNNGKVMAKGMGMFSPPGESGNGRQARSLSLNQRFSSGLGSSSSLSSANSATEEEHRQHDNGKMWMSHEMGDKRENPRFPGGTTGTGNGDVPLDPDVPVMLDDEDDEDGDDEDDGTL